MKKSFFIVCLGIAMLSFAFTACNNNSKHPGYKQTASGLYYKFINQNEGETLKVGDVAELVFSYSVQDTTGRDTLLFSSVEAMKGNPFNDKVQESLFVGDYYEGLRMMHKGDSVSMYISVDSVFTKMFGVPQEMMPKFIKPGSDMRWEVKLVDFCTEEEFLARREAEKQAKADDAKAEFDKYLAENGVEAEPTESGLIYVCTQKGDGLHPQVGNTVSVHYTGKLLNGEVFDSSVERGEPIEFPLGMGHVIPGWDEGIALMSKGEKGVLYIPQNLAYGERTPSPAIPAFSNLVFEVELVDFK